MVSVYGLADPDSGAVRYVGVTQQPILLRAIRHLADAVRTDRKRGLSPGKIAWLKSLAATGRLPEVFLVEDFETAHDARRCEAELISSIPGLLNQMACRKCQTPFLAVSAAGAVCAGCRRKTGRPPIRRAVKKGAAVPRPSPTEYEKECLVCDEKYRTIQPSQVACSAECKAVHKQQKRRAKERRRYARLKAQSAAVTQ